MKILEKDHAYSLIVDGLLGTGIKGKIREPISSAIDIINTLRENEDLIMESNIVLGDLFEARYGTRMGFNADGSFSKDGKVVWPERMVEDESN